MLKLVLDIFFNLDNHFIRTNVCNTVTLYNFKLIMSYLSMPSSTFFLKKLFFSLGEGGTEVCCLEASSEGVLAPGDTLVSPHGCWGGAILVSGDSWGGVSAMADVGPEKIYYSSPKKHN